MKNKSIISPLENVQFDHSLWTNEIDFAIKEMRIYQNKIKEIITNLLDEENIEPWNNMYQKFEDLEKEGAFLKLQVKMHVVEILKKINSNGALEALIDSTHPQVREDIEIFRLRLLELKNRFSQELGAYS